MKILCFANNSPERLWRLDMPKKWIEMNTDWTIDIVDLSKWPIGLGKYDLVIGRSFISEKIVDTFHLWGKKIYYEIDGAEPLLSKEHFDYLKPVYARNMHQELLRTMQKCDAVLVSTPAMASWVKSIVNRPTKLFRNAMDFEWWNKMTCAYEPHDGPEMRIGWFGMKSHVFDIQNILIPIIERLQQEYLFKLYIPESIANIIPSHLRTYIYTVAQWEINERPSLARKYKIDLMLVPLEKTRFNACKSAIKYFENSADKIPGIYSPTVYSEYITHGKTGYIADTLEEWTNAIQILTNRAARITIGKNAFQDVTAHYNAKNICHEWIRAIQPDYESI